MVRKTAKPAMMVIEGEMVEERDWRRAALRSSEISFFRRSSTLWEIGLMWVRSLKRNNIFYAQKLSPAGKVSPRHTS